MRNKLKRIAVDGAGYGLILLGLLTGWLPGPGGIPLILAGLGLLSVNNHWAKQILDYFKKNGSKFIEVIFPNNSWAKAGHDILAIALIVAGVYLAITKNELFYYSIAVALIALGIVDFLYNRQRLNYFKRK